MDSFGDLTTWVTLAVAVFIFLRLRSVLGKRTGYQRPPEDTLARRRANGAGANDKVVPLPKQAPQAEKEGAEVAQSVIEIDRIAKPGTALNRRLREIATADPTLRPDEFLNGAKMAYEMIVTAFADGDRKTLKNLLSREVYDGFAKAISERESRSEQVRAQFIGIDAAKITAGEILKNEVHITVRFVSQIVSATMDAAGKVIDGDPDKIVEVTDLWTFARDPRSKDPNWRLVATESES
jgi:predicted lipid-binding transport protein (Tim44 family)